MIKPLLDRLIIVSLQSIIIRIFNNSSKHKTPSNPLYTIGKIINLTPCYLSIYMIFKLLLQARLNREWVIQELPIKILFGRLTINHSHSFIIILRPSSPSNHLQQICGLKINILMTFSIKKLSTFNNNQPSRKINAPGKCTRSNHNLYFIIDKQLLTNLSIMCI